MMRDEGYKSRYKDKPEKIQIVEDMKHEKGVRVPPPFPMKLEGWPNFWKHGEWNELRAKIFGNPPTITTLINGVKFMEWTDTKKRLGDKGSISLHQSACARRRRFDEAVCIVAHQGFRQGGLLMFRFLTMAVLLAFTVPAIGGEEPLKVLFIGGHNDHNSPIKKALEECGRFTVVRITADWRTGRMAVPSEETTPEKPKMAEFKPDFSQYAVVVSNYNGALWPQETCKALETFVNNGGGLVIVHGAGNAFPQWTEYNRMIGLGGAKRDEKSGPMIRWRDGQIVRDTKPGPGGRHGACHEYAIDTREPNHPIMAGLPAKWMHTSDELYQCLRGPAENLTVLATAFADKAKEGPGASGEHEPALFVIEYGRGRVFHTIMGHDATSTSCVGFVCTLQRGTEWAATGKVTIPKPENFPGPDKTSVWTPKSASTAEKKPNIVFFYVDDLGWADVGYNGATYHLTPNIDALSKKAMVFDNAYTMPTCAPSRVSLFTGMAAPRTGVYHVANFAQTPKEYLKVNPVRSQLHFDRPGFTMLGDTMKAGGYVTGYVGKWHVNKDPMKHGFDANTGGCESGCPRSFFSPYGIPALKDGPEGEYLPERMLDASKTFIKNNKDKPFFLFYAPYLVHRPLQARKEDIAKFESRKKEAARSDPTYAAMVEWTDRAFGDILDTLKNENLADNTIVIFSSDNGINGISGDATPLRGEKGSCYEGGVRVPTMVHWPGVTKAMHNSALIDVLDWYPTLREIAAAPAPEHPLDGVSIVPLLKGQSNSVRDAVYWHMPCYNGRPGNKQIWQTPFSMVRSGKYKLIHFYEDDHVELYDLEKDIGETQNITKTSPEESQVLRGRLTKWLTETKAPLPTKKPTAE